MTLVNPAPAQAGRVATQRTVLMCRPEHFTVVYRINPWMDPQLPTDTRPAARGRPRRRDSPPRRPSSMR